FPELESLWFRAVAHFRTREMVHMGSNARRARHPEAHCRTRFWRNSRTEIHRRLAEVQPCHYLLSTVRQYLSKRAISEGSRASDVLGSRIQTTTQCEAAILQQPELDASVGCDDYAKVLRADGEGMGGRRRDPSGGG